MPRLAVWRLAMVEVQMQSARRLYLQVCDQEVLEAEKASREPLGLFATQRTGNGGSTPDCFPKQRETAGRVRARGPELQNGRSLGKRTKEQLGWAWGRRGPRFEHTRRPSVLVHKPLGGKRTHIS